MSEQFIEFMKIRDLMSQLRSMCKLVDVAWAEQVLSEDDFETLLSILGSIKTFESKLLIKSMEQYRLYDQQISASHIDETKILHKTGCEGE